MQHNKPNLKNSKIPPDAFFLESSRHLYYSSPLNIAILTENKKLLLWTGGGRAEGSCYLLTLASAL